MIDSLVTWARDYKVDGFRFDLMGHHMKVDMEQARDALQALTPAKDGVRGSDIYIYGEGWDFGEVAKNARGVNATQLNMAGTGIGTFNDRIRDAVRGGGPFDDAQDILKNQGFATGLFYDPNDVNKGASGLTVEQQKNRMLLYQDQIRVSLAGNLKDFQFIGRTGVITTGAGVEYNGSPAGYTSDPQEIINYVEAHDNMTLFDAVQLKASSTATITDRVRMDQIANDIVALSQGVPFFQAAQDLLRSKSFDENSYNSGDWFNRIDWTYNTNNFGVGLPPTGTDNWPIYKPLLANPALKPSRTLIEASTLHFQEMLRIRKSSPLFRLRTAEQVQNQLSFLNTGPDQTPGVIVMQLSEPRSLHIGNPFKRVVVVFNATTTTQTFSADTLKGAKLQLHPVQRASADSVTRTSSFDAATGTLTVPARTTAVFVHIESQQALTFMLRK
jgi:pullulanase-type alpha-1,6-glucosidase